MVMQQRILYDLTDILVMCCAVIWVMTDYPRSSATVNCNKELALVVAIGSVSRTVWRPIWRSVTLSPMN